MNKKFLKFTTAMVLSALISVSGAACGENNNQNPKESSLSGSEMSADGSANSQVHNISESPIEDFEYSELLENEITIDKYTGKSTEVVIPAMIDGMSVASISRSAFEGRDDLISITVPDSVQYIDMFAFKDCSNLKTVRLSKKMHVIRFELFSGCSSLTSVTIPSEVEKIEINAFKDCSSLTSITIPNGVTRIKYDTFEGCISLENITIPSTVTVIEKDAFDETKWYNNQNNGLVYVGKVAYKYKGAMPQNTEIVLNDGTTCVSGCAFEDCSGLTSITIPDSVTYMGDEVFKNWTSDQTIYIKGRSSAPASWHVDWNKNCNAKIVWNA